MSQSHSFNPSTVNVIFWYSLSGCSCYLHRCISYFDSPAGSSVNIQHTQRERERERERERQRQKQRFRERERVCVCVCVRERERERERNTCSRHAIMMIIIHLRNVCFTVWHHQLILVYGQDWNVLLFLRNDNSNP